jgi:hypothetical protein
VTYLSTLAISPSILSSGIFLENAVAHTKITAIESAEHDGSWLPIANLDPAVARTGFVWVRGPGLAETWAQLQSTRRYDLAARRWIDCFTWNGQLGRLPAPPTEYRIGGIS